MSYFGLLDFCLGWMVGAFYGGNTPTGVIGNAWVTEGGQGPILLEGTELLIGLEE